MREGKVCPLMSTVIRVDYTRESRDELKKAECIRQECALWDEDYQDCGLKTKCGR
jgi:hypothetical protein